MGIVAAKARLQRVVHCRLDLGKTGWSCRVVPVAELAEVSPPWGGRMDTERIFSVGTASPVAHLTGDPAMEARRVDGGNVRVAHCTGLAPGVLHLLAGNSFHRGRSVMSCFPEGLRNQEVSCRDQADNGQAEKSP